MQRLGSPTRSAPGARPVVLVVCALVMLGGFLLKAQCLAPWDGRQYSRLCYTDIIPLYDSRGLNQGGLPYIHGSLQDGQLQGGAIEYPVLTGVFMWATARLVGNADDYLRISAIFLFPFGLVVAYLLAGLRQRRALLWAAAPALVLYSFHNWDLLVVAAAVAGVWMWVQGRPGWAGALFGIGAALKLYPILFLVPLALERLRTKDRNGAVVGLGAGVGTTVLINLPFAVANPDGWFATYRYHALRGADFNSIWYWIPSSEGSVHFPWATVSGLNLVTAVLTGAFFLAAVGIGWQRSRQEGSYPFLQVCGAVLASFLLWNKVHSPQYALWILPFFVLLRVNLWWWVAYAIADLAVYVGIFRWFYEVVYLHAAMDATTLWKEVLMAGIWARAALLLALFVAFLQSPITDADGRKRREGDSLQVPQAAALT
jgi:uncharacterized membrane protein